MSVGVFRLALSSHTCIRIAEERKYTYYIPMSSLSLERQDIREFNQEWVEFEGYGSAEAAQKYLDLPKFREFQPKARALLRLVATGKPVTLDPAQLNKLIDQEIIMSEAMKNAPSPVAPKAAPKTAPALKGAGFGAKVSKPVPGVPSTPAALAAAKGKPAPVAKPVAAEKPAPKGKPVPVAKPAPTPAATKGKPAPKAAATPAPAAKGKAAAPEAVKERAPRAPKEPDNTKYTVGGDDSSIKRGMSRDYVDAAKKLKTFTREKLSAATESVQPDAGKRAGYFNYFLGKGIFTAV